MTSDIEKMYENANIIPKKIGYCNWDSDCPYPEKECGDECPYWKYEDKATLPPFAAEKQLKLIKWLMINNKDYQYDLEDNKFWFYIDDCRETKYREFDEALAELINLYWQDLTEEEKEEIREILH